MVFDLGGDLLGGFEVVEVFVGEAFAEATETAFAVLIRIYGFEKMKAVLSVIKKTRSATGAKMAEPKAQPSLPSQPTMPPKP